MKTEKRFNFRRLSGGNFSLYSGLVVVLIVMSIILSITTDSFATSVNITNVLRQVSIMAILGAGMGVLMTTGDLDLSVGSGLGLLGAVMALLVTHNVHPGAAFLIILAFGILMGMIEGFFVALLGMPAFVVTLAFEYIWRGVLYIITDGMPVTKLPPNYTAISTSGILGVSWPIWIMLLVFIIFGIVMGMTKMGREFYAAGDNAKAAEYAGLNTKMIRMKGFIMMGVCVAIAGMLQTARLQSAQPTAGTGMELEAITASALGGINAGTGSIIGVLFGAIVLGVITNGMTLLALNTYMQRVVKGAIIIAAVLWNMNKDKIRTKRTK